MRNFDGFIFDIDGTLSSTNDLIFATFNHVTEKYLNKTFSNEEIVSLFGPTEDGILKEMMGHNFDDARKDYFDFYSDKHNTMADIFPGIRDALAMIKAEGLPISIFTGKGRDSSLITLEKIGVLEYFDMIVSGDDVQEHKPSPEGIRKFVEKFGLQNDRVLMVGDAPSDIKAARSAGTKVAYVLWDEYARNRNYELESDFVFHTVEEFKTFVDKNIH